MNGPSCMSDKGTAWTWNQRCDRILASNGLSLCLAHPPLQGFSAFPVNVLRFCTDNLRKVVQIWRLCSIFFRGASFPVVLNVRM